MPAKLDSVRTIFALLLSLTLAAAAHGLSAPALAPAQAQALVNRALATESRAAQDLSHVNHPMRYRLRKSSPRLTSTKEIVETREGFVARLVAIDEVLYFHASDKYTEAVTAAERHLVRTPLKELLNQLNPQYFTQIHRSVIVNLRAVDRIERDLLGRSQVYLRNHPDVLRVSRSYLDRFKQS